MFLKTNRRDPAVHFVAAAAIAAASLVPNVALAQTYTLTTLATFTGTNGYNPYSEPLLDSSGNLFGTTNGGGDLSQKFGQGDGTVYEIAAGTDTLTTIATFEGTNGVDPDGDLIMDSHGNLYGTTSAFGGISQGTVFEIAAGSGTITTLATFAGTNGAAPAAGLTLYGGNLYGTAYDGGANGDGTVFEIAAGSGAVTTLASFTGANGANPEADLTVDSKGNLYGTTTAGGASGDGTVFEIAAGSGTVSTLATFNGANGANPYAGLTLTGGNLYGTTEGGGASADGTVFEIASGSGGIGTGALTTLYSFSGIDGVDPYGNLTLDSNGNLFGSTVAGGASDDGTVFEIASGSGGIGTGGLTTLYAFDGADGAYPFGLALGSGGDLYSATSGGGANFGTVFELTPSASGAASAPEPGTLAMLMPGCVLFGLTVAAQRKKLQ